MTSFVVRGGHVVDGTGAPIRAADVLVQDGRVAAIDDLGGLEQPDILDATGCVVAPGFVDIHSHADFSLLAFPDAASAVRQGVTIGPAGGRLL